MTAPEHPDEACAQLTPDESTQIFSAMSDYDKTALLAFISTYRADVFTHALRRMSPSLLPERLRKATS